MVVALFALGDALGVEMKLLLEGAVRPIAEQFAHIHPVFPAAFLIHLPCASNKR